MTLTILYFAQLAEERGAAQERLTGDYADLAALYNALHAQHRFSLAQNQLRVARNQMFAEWTDAPQDGDETHLTADGHAWLARVRTQAETFRQFLATHNINPTELLAMHFNISTRNQLKGTISAVQEGAVNSEIAISIGAHPLTAIITRASAERLGLKAGVEAYALIKASDVMIGSADIAAQISARNAIPGTISRIETGAVNDEVTLDIGDGNSLVAIITRTSAERLGFRVGQNACAIIKASNVMIGC